MALKWNYSASPVVFSTITFAKLRGVAIARRARAVNTLGSRGWALGNNVELISINMERMPLNVQYKAGGDALTLGERHGEEFLDRDHVNTAWGRGESSAPADGRSSSSSCRGEPTQLGERERGGKHLSQTAAPQCCFLVHRVCKKNTSCERWRWRGSSLWCVGFYGKTRLRRAAVICSLKLLRYVKTREV